MSVEPLRENLIRKLWLCFGLFLISCKRHKPSPEPLPSGQIQGYELLSQLPGLWEGPVVSTTSVGNFPTWKVDFRPISSAQISARNELDSANNIHMSFFPVRYGEQATLCFRNGGFFGGIERITYLLLDSSAAGYYRFAEPLSKGRRAYAELFFPSPDSVVLASYTNKLGTVSEPVLHMRWTARRWDRENATEATQHFGFPKPLLVKDLSQAFAGRQEAIYYTPIQGDPYPSSAQPYVGRLCVYYQHASAYTPEPERFVWLFTTTKPLLEGYQYFPDRMRFITRYVRVAASQSGFCFEHMHPGRYYLYVLYDADGNDQPSSGDWLGFLAEQTEVRPEMLTVTTVPIGFRLP